MLDWNDLRLFLAIARHGSLTRAAGALKITQPTAGRRLKRLEEQVETRLFERTARGFELSSTGQAIVEEAERMEAAADAAERRLAGQDSTLAGLVRITSLEWFASDILAPSLARFGLAHPAIEIELISDVRQFSLTKREADLAIRFTPFEQLDLAQQKIGHVTIGLYATETYLSTHGMPDLAAGMPGHAIICLHEAASHIPEMRWLLNKAGNARLAFRSNSTHALLRAARVDAGLVVVPDCTAVPSWGLVRLETAEPIPGRDVWLGVHEDLRHVPRIRRVIDHLTETVRQRLALS